MEVNGKIVGVGLLGVAAAAGLGVYYAQIFAFYEDVPVDTASVEVTSVVSGQPEAISFTDFQAIDAESSPIRYRACFKTDLSLALMTETYALLDGAEPLNAPPWFECFNSEEIGHDISAGDALAFMGQRNFEYGIDRIVAVYPDGRGFVWHQVNECGDKLYDGTPAGSDCPEREN